MKSMKTFVKTCYSEGLLASLEDGSNEKVDSSFTSVDEAAGSFGKEDEPTYQGGLGLKFKFPGDPKKCVISADSCWFLRSYVLSGFVKHRRSNYGQLT